MAGVFGVRCAELIKELKRCDTAGNGFLSNYNDKVLQEVFEEMQDLFDQNKLDVANLGSEEERDELFMAVKMRHYGMIRNHRCVMAYLMTRVKYIRSLRWGFGTNIPQDIQRNMSENESKWFESYNKLLFTYMKNVTEDGIDLCQEQDPPKFRFITVRCIKDYGDLILSDGNRVAIKKGIQEIWNVMRTGLSVTHAMVYRMEGKTHQYLPTYMTSF